MAITFSFELKDRPNRAGRYPIYLRITEDRKLKRMKTSVDLEKKADWNPKQQKVRQSEKNSALYNRQLEIVMEAAKTANMELAQSGAPASAQIAKKLKGEEGATTLLAFSCEVLQDLYDSKQLGNWKKYNSFVSKLRVFLTDRQGRVKDVTFAEVTPDFVRAFERFLKMLPNERDKDTNLHPNTIVKLLKVFRAIVNKAQSERKLLLPQDNPFMGITLAEIPTTKEKLTEAELQALEAVEAEVGSLLWYAQQAFFLSYYCAGIRAGDLIQLRWCYVTPEGRLLYTMGKNNKKKDIVLVPQAQEILRLLRKEGQKPTDYIFPYLDNAAPYAKAVTYEARLAMAVGLREQLFNTINAREVQLNKQLRILAAMAGIEKHISFHISRHSFAKMAKAAGTDNALLKGMMNHSSLTTTERYMKDIDNSKEDEALLKIFADQKKEAGLLEALRGLDEEALQALLSKLK